MLHPALGSKPVLSCNNWYLIVLIGCLLSLITNLSLANTVSSKPVSTLLVVGDSLSAAYNIPVAAGWVSLLEARLQQQQLPWQVVNASISGETTGGGLSRLPDLLRLHQPQIVLLALGANDGLRGLPPRLIRQQLEQMLALNQQAGAKTLLIGIFLPRNYGAAYLDAFEQIYAQLAVQHQLSLVPFLLAGVADKPELMQADGLHPTAAAQPLILENVWVELLPKLH